MHITRMRIFACLLVVGVGWTATAQADQPNAAEQLQASTWPMFRGDPQSRGVAASSLPEQLTLLWQVRIENDGFEGTAAIADGTVFIGSLNGSLFAFDLADGTEKWKLQTEIGFATSPSYRAGRLYLGDFDGKFFCVSADSGQIEWTYQVDAEINSCANFYKDSVLFGSQDSTLYCLDAVSGKLNWKHSINDQIRCTPSIVANRGFVAGCDARLHVIDLDIGQSAAGVELDGPTGATPAIDGDVAYCGTEGGTFYAIDWRKEEVVWSFQDPQRAQPLRSSPAVKDNVIVVGGHSKQVYGMAKDSGAKLWTFDTRKQVDSSPVIVDQRVFIGSRDGRLYALELASGHKVWEYETGGALNASPAVAAGRLVIASDEGVIYCFGEKVE